MAEVMTTDTPPILAAALDYARKGIPVFPCNIAKEPLTPQGFKNATTDADTIRLWWAVHPGAIIGVPTGAASGWAVLDLDHKPNKFGVTRNGTAALMEITGGQVIPDTVEITTPSGGRHIYFRNQAGFKCSTDDATGIDVRADGGYVCVPPSPGYMYSNPPGLFDIADVPDFLLDIMRNGTRKRVHDDHMPAPVPSRGEIEDTNPDDVRAILDEFWNPDDYHDWSTAALALHTIADGYAIWSAWAAKSPKFVAAENVRKWNQSTPTRGITARSILARAPRDRLSELARSRVTSAPVLSIFQGGKTEQPVGGVNEPAGINAVSFLSLLTDTTPDEPDYIEPNFLGPGNFCLIAGPPKAQKSFLLTEMLVACATGSSFLSGAFTVPRPLKVFYLQAEMNRKLLRKRARMMGFLPVEQKQLLATNLFVTERFHMLLDEKGVEIAAEAIRKAFPDGGPDIIAIDPLANLFDGESEDRAPEVMAFLTQRVDRLRRLVNPAAAILMVHHSAKKNAEDMNRDPFVAIRGSGALRGYYDTGVIIYRKSEDGPERKVFIECRSGESPDPMTVRLTDRGTFEVVDSSMAGITRTVAVQMLDEISRRWSAGRPLSLVPQTRREGRFAPLVFAQQFGVTAEQVAALIEQWMMNGICEVQVFDTDSKMKGIRKVQNL